MIDAYKLDVANKVLALMFKKPQEFWLDNNNGRLILFWVHYRIDTGKYQIRSRRWATKRGGFYPVFGDLPTGGTAQQAIGILANWVRNYPTESFRAWRYFASDSVKLVNQEVLDLLAKAGYPQQSKCRFCGNENPKRFDWYYVDKQHFGLGCYPQCDAIKKAIAKKNRENMFV